MEYAHTSVLANELLENLKPFGKNPIMLDCTLGEGGHSLLFLQNYDSLKVIGLDRDPIILERAKLRLEPYKERFTAVNTWFDDYLNSYDGNDFTLILFDLGISMFHYQESQRGFSFSKNELLDMRLDPNYPFSASDIVNTFSQNRLADLIYQFGEERYSRRIARAIVNRREKEPISKANDLAEIVFHAVPSGYRYGRIHPATKTFQALRIGVNRELERITPALERGIEHLRPGGLIAVISFHSLEDRLVKHLFKKKVDGCICPPETPRCVCDGKPLIKIITKKPLVATEKECAANPAARSAKLRIAQKVEDAR